MCSAAAIGASKSPKMASQPKSKFVLTSPSFRNGQPIPAIHALKPLNQPPTLEWSHAPKGTKSFALIMSDPDARPRTFIHWIVANIPSTESSLSEPLNQKRTLPNGIIQGKNDFGKIGYGGPYPPIPESHTYYFELTALDIPQLSLPKDFTVEDLEAAMKGHKLGTAKLRGTFARSAASIRK